MPGFTCRHADVLKADGVLYDLMGMDGVYARTALYEQVIEGLCAFISDLREPHTGGPHSRQRIWSWRLRPYIPLLLGFSRVCHK